MLYGVLFSVFWVVGCGVNSQTFNGDNCTPSPGSGATSGTCTPLKECPAAILAVQSGMYPDICGFEGNMPVVCCSNGNPGKESISQKKCREYATFEPEYQIFAIVAGTQAEPREFPHMAALGYVSGQEVLWQCGGSLVSEEYVLTAAHCLNHISFGPVARVRLGDLNLASTTDIAAPQDFSIKSTIPHPSYKSPSVYNDIALVLLDRPVQFTNFVKPACLYVDTLIPSNMELIATGWGLTEQGGNPSKTLQKVDLKLTSDQECNSTYANLAGSRRLRGGINYKEQFCAGGQEGTDKDTCQGDSGGPLQTYIRSERIYSIVGVTSFGKVCGASVPGVYSKVAFYVPWLESVIWSTK